MTPNAATPQDDDAESFDDIRLDRIGKLMDAIADEQAEKDRLIEAQRAEIERLTKENARLGWGLSYAEEGRDDFKARAAAAEAALADARAKFERAAAAHHRCHDAREAALSASQERERAMREVLGRLVDFEGSIWTTEFRKAMADARAALQQETADVR
ncbi:chromosome segregation ATPase [Azospirillum picis]|uniref:hypothetical protein n=1 Tax=Azospirillum picis TaxID=488438 RepID=UPI001AE5F304|nr:hypothetical protein [Azospirillum picis]MBP2301521.1 chromosome segregation ATPase [Azospirillum picis]